MTEKLERVKAQLQFDEVKSGQKGDLNNPDKNTGGKQRLISKILNDVNITEKTIKETEGLDYNALTVKNFNALSESAQVSVKARMTKEFITKIAESPLAVHLSNLEATQKRLYATTTNPFIVESWRDFPFSDIKDALQQIDYVSKEYSKAKALKAYDVLMKTPMEILSEKYDKSGISPMMFDIISRAPESTFKVVKEQGAIINEWEKKMAILVNRPENPYNGAELKLINDFVTFLANGRIRYIQGKKEWHISNISKLDKENKNKRIWSFDKSSYNGKFIGVIDPTKFVKNQKDMDLIIDIAKQVRQFYDNERDSGIFKKLQTQNNEIRQWTKNHWRDLQENITDENMLDLFRVVSQEFVASVDNYFPEQWTAEVRQEYLEKHIDELSEEIGDLKRGFDTNDNIQSVLREEENAKFTNEEKESLYRYNQLKTELEVAKTRLKYILDPSYELSASDKIKMREFDNMMHRTDAYPKDLIITNFTAISKNYINNAAEAWHRNAIVFYYMKNYKSVPNNIRPYLEAQLKWFLNTKNKYELLDVKAEGKKTTDFMHMLGIIDFAANQKKLSKIASMEGWFHYLTKLITPGTYVTNRSQMILNSVTMDVPIKKFFGLYNNVRHSVGRGDNSTTIREIAGDYAIGEIANKFIADLRNDFVRNGDIGEGSFLDNEMKKYQYELNRILVADLSKGEMKKKIKLLVKENIERVKRLPNSNIAKAFIEKATEAMNSSEYLNRVESFWIGVMHQGGKMGYTEKDIIDSYNAMKSGKEGVINNRVLKNIFNYGRHVTNATNFYMSLVNSPEITKSAFGRMFFRYTRFNWMRMKLEKDIVKDFFMNRTEQSTTKFKNMVIINILAMAAGDLITEISPIAGKYVQSVFSPWGSLLKFAYDTGNSFLGGDKDFWDDKVYWNFPFLSPSVLATVSMANFAYDVATGGDGETFIDIAIDSVFGKPGKGVRKLFKDAKDVSDIF